jgi:uncharacterized protein (TIGR02246 family)
MDEQQLSAEIWELIQTMNRTWTVEGDADRLAEFFHERMVAITPTDRHRREGREACIAGWRGFLQMATVTRWEEQEPSIQIHDQGKAAVVSYHYDMTCLMGGQKLELRGRDLLFLVKELGRWWIVADQFSPFPPG